MQASNPELKARRKSGGGREKAQAPSPRPKPRLGVRIKGCPSAESTRKLLSLRIDYRELETDRTSSLQPPLYSTKQQPWRELVERSSREATRAALG